MQSCDAAVEPGADEHADSSHERKLFGEGEPAQRCVVGDDWDATVRDCRGENLAVGQGKRRPAQTRDQAGIWCGHATCPARLERQLQLRFARPSLPLVNYLATDGWDYKNVAALFVQALYLPDSGQRNERATVDHCGH